MLELNVQSLTVIYWASSFFTVCENVHVNTITDISRLITVVEFVLAGNWTGKTV